MPEGDILCPHRYRLALREAQGSGPERLDREMPESVGMILHNTIYSDRKKILLALMRNVSNFIEFINFKTTIHQLTR